MAAILQTSFLWAYRVIERFHMQRLAIDAVSNLRIKHKREEMEQENIERKELMLKQKARRHYIKIHYKVFIDGHPIFLVKGTIQLQKDFYFK